MGKKILVVDDESTARQRLCALLGEQGYVPVPAASGLEALTRLHDEDFDLCLTDLDLRGTNGFSVLEAARRRHPSVPVIVMTAQGRIRDAIAALRAGALDFVAKPVSAVALDTAVRRLLDSALPSNGWRPTQGAALIGEHPAVRLVLERVEQVADTDASVLIRGETGTGKEVVARLVHAASERRTGPFVAVNMAAIPDPLAESELLGHTRGAFTGAERSRPGKIVAAEAGTLFLDEIGDMSKALQSKLLRVLQEREVQPLGATEPVRVNVRIIAATHRNLEQMVRDDEFREDLFYRLDVIPIELPPLRDRPEDIPLLVEHFRIEMNARHGRSVPGFTADALDRLRSYDWPGNVRQLANVVERLIIVAGDRAVALDDLPPNLRTSVLDLANTPLDLPPSGVDLRLLLSQLEDRLIGQALKRTGGNKNRAAELLGLNRTTLVEKLRRRNVA
ncbi:MAG: sigma-54 dependent transcriptional regulator [Myxococcales bacterium]|nr:sigma-54 dependent transcriptional regulator [Myxococcales bacterium]